jgi:mono/diheme cytochrome c family protein
MRTSFLFFVLLAVPSAGCRGEVSSDPPLVPIRNMYDQPRFDMQSGTTMFEDGRTMRPAIEGTISREDEIDPRIARGRLEDESGYVLTIPDEVVTRGGGMGALTERGRDRYGIYCTPCHSLTGDGKGMIIKRGMLPPPSYHQKRLREAPDGQLYATIENGKGNMPAYGPQIPIQDRWAIVAYVRALQVSQAGVATPPEPTPTTDGGAP